MLDNGRAEPPLSLRQKAFFDIVELTVKKQKYNISQKLYTIIKRKYISLRHIKALTAIRAKMTDGVPVLNI